MRKHSTRSSRVLMSTLLMASVMWAVPTASFSREGSADSTATQRAVNVGLPLGGSESLQPASRPSASDQVMGVSPPETTIDSEQPAQMGPGEFSLEFSSNDLEATFQCRIDSDFQPPEWYDCESPLLLEFPNEPAQYSIMVRAVNAGGVDETPATWDVEIVPLPTCSAHIVTIEGSPEADDIVGTEGDDVIDAGAGGDHVDGGGGDDVICGGDGNDTLTGGEGNDVLSGGADVNELSGGLGNDTLAAFNELGPNKFYGGPGSDRVYGGTGEDEAFGGGGNDTMRGYDGNDALLGNAGTDDLFGGLGVDSCGQEGASSFTGCSLPFKVGKTAPNLVGLNAYNNKVSLRDLRGKHVLINFSTFWCAPSSLMAQYADPVTRKLNKAGVPFAYLSVELEISPGNPTHRRAAEVFTTKYGMRRVSVLHVNGKKDFESNLFKQFLHYIDANERIEAFPNQVFINKQGKITEIHEGLLTAQELLDRYKPGLTVPPPAEGESYVSGAAIEELDAKLVSLMGASKRRAHLRSLLSDAIHALDPLLPGKSSCYYLREFKSEVSSVAALTPAERFDLISDVKEILTELGC